MTNNQTMRHEICELIEAYCPNFDRQTGLPVGSEVEQLANLVLAAVTRTPPTSTDERKDVLEEAAIPQMRPKPGRPYYLDGSIYKGMEATIWKDGRTVAHCWKFAEAIELVASANDTLEALTPNPTIDDHGGEATLHDLISDAYQRGYLNACEDCRHDPGRDLMMEGTAQFQADTRDQQAAILAALTTKGD